MRLATSLKTSAWFAYASGTVGAVGVPLLVAMYAVIVRRGREDPGVERLGIPNDVLVLVQYALALPVAVTLHALNRATNPRLSATATALGVSALTAYVVLQALLLAGYLEFEEQIGYVLIAMLVLLVWFLMVGQLGRSSGYLSGRTTLMSLLGASYIGYPIWAFWLGRQLHARAALETESAG